MYIYKVCKCSTSLFCLTNALNFFPFFLYLITTVIAIDKLLLVTKDYNYKTFVRKGKLKIVVGLVFTLSDGYTSLFVSYGINREKLFLLFIIVDLSSTVIFPLIIVVAYMCILCYVYRRSNAMPHCKVRVKNTNKKLIKTIMLILCSQSLLTLRYAFLNLLLAAEFFNDFIHVSLKLYFTLLNWFFFILWNCQFLVNGMIFLINHRKRIQRKRENTRKTEVKSSAAV